MKLQITAGTVIRHVRSDVLNQPHIQLLWMFLKVVLFLKQIYPIDIDIRSTSQYNIIDSHSLKQLNKWYKQGCRVFTFACLIHTLLSWFWPAFWSVSRRHNALNPVKLPWEVSYRGFWSFSDGPEISEWGVKESRNGYCFSHVHKSQVSQS